MRAFTALILAILTSATMVFAQTQAKPLEKLLVILDPGHGGTDPGANIKFNGFLMAEDEYVYDVALRVEELAKNLGATVFLTIRETSSKSDKSRNWKESQIFPNEDTESFSLDNTQVEAGRIGLKKRLDFAHEKARAYRSKIPIFISIHFDALYTSVKDLKTGKSVLVPKEDIEGTRIVASNFNLIAPLLKKTFGSAHRLRAEFPLVPSPDPNHGIRDLFILRRNKIEQKVLIELGNFSNPTDVWRLRHYPVRDAYAAAIVQALVKFNRTLP